MQMSKKCVDLFWAHSPGQNFGVFECSTSEKNFIRSIQNKTLNDISKFTYVIRSFILNTPHKIFFQSMVFQNSKKRRPHSPGQNFGALEYHTPKKIL